MDVDAPQPLGGVVDRLLFQRFFVQGVVPTSLK
jgi:hypothetical protein